MKKRIIVLPSFLMLLGIGMVRAADAYTGIIATVEGSETSYALSEVPQVTYTDKDGVKYANITLKGQTAPAVSVALENGRSLSIVYGTYTPASIEEASSDTVSVTERGGKKYIHGGKLVIIGRDGRKYDTSGKEIK